MFFIGCLNNLSWSMSTRPSNQHAYSGCEYICLTKWNSDIEGLSQCRFISFIHINNRIWLYITNSSNYFISIFLNWNYESFAYLWRSSVRVHFYLNCQNIHYLSHIILFLAIDAIDQIEFWCQFIRIDIAIECDKSNIGWVWKFIDNI